MNHIKSYKIFESSSDMDEIREVFTDSDLEDNNIDVVYVTEKEGVQISLNKNFQINSNITPGRIPSARKIKNNLERILMTKEEYFELHDLIMSKITYLHDVDIECVNVIYCMMDDKFGKTYKSLTEYFDENKNMADFLNFLYSDDKKIAMIMLYFRFR